MKYGRWLGAYLLVAIGIIAVLSFLQVYRGQAADFSFVFAAPFAVGVMLGKRWGAIGAGILGVGVSVLAVVIAAMGVVSGTKGLTVYCGPIVLNEPGLVALWALTAGVIMVLGLPMASAWWLPAGTIMPSCGPDC